MYRRNEQFEKKERELGNKEKELHKREEAISENENRYQEILTEQRRQLERISGLTAEQAKELLIHAMENEARYEGAKLIKRIESEAKEEADKKAKDIIATATQRYSGDFVAERTVSVVQLPNAFMHSTVIARFIRSLQFNISENNCLLPTISI